MGGTVEQFIEHWRGASGGERAQSQSFLVGLCQVLGVEAPKDGDYKFEYAIPGERGTDFIDLYKRGAFVLEAKQSRAKGASKAVAGQEDYFHVEHPTVNRGRSGRAWDVLMLNARQQAENYARHLPSSHEWPPFIVVCDVGHCFELYADFTGKGRNYTQFPDRQGFRIFLEDLAKQEVRERLVKMWTDPHALDPTKRAAKATREIAERLAAVSKRLEAKSYPPEEVALFLMRCLFTMFAEDTDLIPKGAFSTLLSGCVENPKAFMPSVKELWIQMNLGGFAVSIGADVRRFNGHLFANAHVFPMDREDIGELKEAAGRDWQEVDPSIFGTLLEQALDARERARLGAHYTPRAYVERLVIATVIEPLREEWNAVLATAERLKSEESNKDAAAVVHAFHEKLCETRVLDPACGTGNFLYIALELMKRLEGEVLETLLNLGGQEVLAGLERHEVDPHQFLGLEINPRAAAIAELVLWIGYLRWHLRTRGTPPSEPILKEFRNIEKRDAVLEHGGFDAKGNYVNPRRPQWPEADYIVGNPPFIGKGEPMREALGDPKLEALWRAHKHMNESADLVMYWWDRAAEILAHPNTRLKRFGLVTTNSITQLFNRRVVQRHLSSISIIMAIGNHPWTKATRDAAAVRIAMTVARPGQHGGVVFNVTRETGLDTDDPTIETVDNKGTVNADLTIGADVTSTHDLIANTGLAYNGVMLAGRGFVLKPSLAEHIVQADGEAAKSVVKQFIGGGDLVRKRVPKYVLDTLGLSSAELRDLLPNAYQHLIQTVKPERDVNRDKAFKEKWWLFGRNRPELRAGIATLSRYIGTTETTKHRAFQFLRSDVLPDHMVVAISTSDAFHLGILSSRIHVIWALRAGGWLGVGNDPRYSKSRCFDPFPFADPEPGVRARIADIAEKLDRHRKDIQRDHPDITMTGMYNVLEKVRSAEPLKDNERRILDGALILILKELHDELDDAVAEAYGWPADLGDEEILSRLVALNKQRAVEEANGHVRWLRPDYQIPRFGTPKEKQEQIEADLDSKPAKAAKSAFPQGAVNQTAAVMASLAEAPAPLTPEQVAITFKQGRKVEKTVFSILASLARTGFIASLENGKRYAVRRAP